MSYTIVAPKRKTMQGAITINAHRADATAKVNNLFNNITQADLHRDTVHSLKRPIAGLVVAGGAPTPEFLAEATLRGITPSDLAALILAKPDNVAVRELARQKMMLKIEAAATKPEIDAILTNGPELTSGK